MYFPVEQTVYKQLLDDVFVISRIIKVEVGVISRSGRLRLITLTEKSVSGVGAGFKLCMRNSLVRRGSLSMVQQQLI